MSWESGLQEPLKLLGIAALNKETVRIVPVRQGGPPSGYASFLKTSREALRCLLAAAVVIRIKGQIDGAWAVAELPKLTRIEMGSQRAGDVLKSGLPHRSIVEQPFDEDHFRIGLDSLP